MKTSSLHIKKAAAILLIFMLYSGICLAQNKLTSVPVIPAGPAVPNITAAEGFFDTDPGAGKGISISTGAAGKYISVNNVTLSVASLTKGEHQLYIRTRDASGRWSLTNVIPFFKDFIIPVIGSYPTVPNVVSAEYFFDTDPGFGKGKAIPLTVGRYVAISNFSADISALAEGPHTMYVRTKDALGGWSLTNITYFFIAPPIPVIHVNPASSEITAGEYFFDTDPGFGNGKPITVNTPGQYVNISNLNLDISNLAIGSHTLYLRMRDANDRWSLANIVNFYITGPLNALPSNPALSKIVKGEYFIDKDKGEGKDAPLTVIGTPAFYDSLKATASQLDTLTNATHPFYMRTQDANGRWSLTNMDSVKMDFGVRTPKVLPNTLTAGMIGKKFSDTVSATDGARPFTFAITSGALPAGLSLNDSTGIISGTPTQAGDIPFTVTATDANVNPSYTGSLSYTLHIAPPVITLSPAAGALPGGNENSAYSQTFQAAGGTASYTYTASGALPTGLTLDNTTGVLSGAPTAGGNFSFTVTAQDASTGTGSPFTGVAAYTLHVVSTGPCVTISSQPVSKTDCEGSNVSFSVTASGSNLSYQWQSSTNGGSTWSAINGATSSTLTVQNVTTSETNTEYEVVVQSKGCGSITSVAAKLIVNAKPAITTQPASQTVTAGNNTSFTVTATGAGVTYQWQMSTNGTTWNNVNGATNATLQLSDIPISDNGNQYHVVITGTCGTITSDIATLTVKASCIAPAITTQPASQTVTAGDNASFNVTATGSGLTYQWQMSTNGTTWNNVNGATNSTLGLSDVQASVNGNQYRVVVTGTCGTITSNAAKLTVNTPNLTIAPLSLGNATVGSPYHVTFTTTGGTAPYAYTASGTLPEGITLTNSGTFSGTPAKTGHYSFTVTVTDNNHISSSDAYTLDVICTTPVTTTLNETICEGDSYAFNGENISTAGTYRDTLPAASGCDSVITLNLTVGANASIVKQPTDQSVCAGANASFSVQASGKVTGYQWQMSTDGTTWNNISGETNQTLQLSSLPASDNGNQYRVVITGSCENITSSAATLTVNASIGITINADQSNPVSKGMVVNLTASGAENYTWASATGILSGKSSNILQVLPLDNTTYTVTGRSAGGCTGQQNYEVQIVTDYKLIANNILTPNGDGKNDTWIIANIAGYPNNEVMIFDRSGRMVYHKKNYDNTWDGTINGGPLQEGTYYYIFIVDGGKKIFKGFIELIR